MKHFASVAFWERYHNLPASVRAIADKNYALLKADRWHPSLHFKKVGKYWPYASDAATGRLRPKWTDSSCGFGSVRIRTMTS